MNAIELNPGDRVLFEYGTEHRGQLLVSRAGTVEAPIVIGAYGNPEDGLPVINNLDLLDDAKQWTQYDGDVWTYPYPFSIVSRLFLDRTAVGKAVDVASVNEAKRYYFDGESIYLYSPEGNPASIYSLPGVEVAGLRMGQYATNLQSYVTFENLRILGGCSQSIWLSGCEGAVIRNCRLEYVGKYGIYSQYSAHQNVIQDNVINRMWSVAENPAQKGVGYDGIIFFDSAEGNIIKGNVVRDFDHGQIGLYGTNGSAGGVRQNIVEGNELSAPKCAWGYGFSVVGLEGKIDGNVVRRNFIHDTPEEAQFSAHDCECYYNIFARIAGQAGLSVYSAGVYLSHDLVVANNVFYGCPRSGLRLNAWSQPIANITIRNNILAHNDVEGSGRQFFINQDGAPVTGVIFENNLLYSPLTSDTIQDHVTGVGDNIYTPAEANLLEGFAANLEGDPLFVNVSGEYVLDTDFQVGIGSPAIDAGQDVGLEEDYAGRLVGTPPNIGAWD